MKRIHYIQKLFFVKWFSSTKKCNTFICTGVVPLCLTYATANDLFIPKNTVKLQCRLIVRFTVHDVQRVNFVCVNPSLVVYFFHEVYSSNLMTIKYCIIFLVAYLLQWFYQIRMVMHNNMYADNIWNRLGITENIQSAKQNASISRWYSITHQFLGFSNLWFCLTYWTQIGMIWYLALPHVERIGPWTVKQSYFHNSTSV